MHMHMYMYIHECCTYTIMYMYMYIKATTNNRLLIILIHIRILKSKPNNQHVYIIKCNNKGGAVNNWHVATTKCPAAESLYRSRKVLQFLVIMVALHL